MILEIENKNKTFLDADKTVDNKKKRKHFSYSKWGYLFLIPFFVAFFLFTFLPLISTFYYSFFEYYSVGLDEVGPNFVKFENYKQVIFESQFFKYLGNTIIIWLLGFIPQIIISLLLAVLFTDTRLKLKFTGFFKSIIYMPNLVMASAFGMLFLTIFSTSGPIANILIRLNITKHFDYSTSIWMTRGLIASMNLLMWFGNTTILLMAGVMGIDISLFEAARIDGANSWKIFFKITMPLLRPIFLFVLLTSMIGGIQLFDIPQVFTRGMGNPNLTSKTVIMYLAQVLGASKNYGAAGAASVMLFFITVVLSLVLFVFTYKKDISTKHKGRKA